MSFTELGLRAEILRAIAEEGYTEPTPIQAKAIPVVLAGRDLMAAAQTGTGKTAGFTLPILQLLSTKPAAARGKPRVLVLTPTRELAAQVEESVRTYGKHLPLKATVIYGGVNMNPQIEALRSGITDMHEKFIDQINKEMSISILGQTLTTDITKVGSFAAAKVHNFVRQDILWGDIIEFQNILTTQYVHKDYFLNYGEPPNGYPHFEFITDEIQDFESNARTLYELKIAYPNMQFKKKEVYDRTGWSEPVEGDELI